MSSESKFHYWKYIKYLVVWIVAFVIFLILVDYLKISTTNELTLFGMLTSLIIVGTFHTKGRTHFGLVPSIVGFYLILVAGGLLFGDLEFDMIKKQKWWHIEDQAQKIYLGISTFIGFILMKIGIKTTLQNWWWWRFFGRKGNR